MVAMSINIKNPQTHRLVLELAELTGENMTTAVTVAVRERRDRIVAQRRGSKAEQMLELGRDCARRLPAPVRSIDHAELLYGEDGLPG